MKISKKDALSWFEFFAQLPAGEQLLVKQQEIVYATFAQIEAVVIKRKEELMEQIPGLKTLKDRTLFGKSRKLKPRGKVMNLKCLAMEIHSDSC